MEEMKVSYFPPLRKQYKVHRDVGVFSPHPSDILSSGLQDVMHAFVPLFFSFHLLQLTLGSGAEALGESKLVGRCL